MPSRSSARRRTLSIGGATHDLFVTLDGSVVHEVNSAASVVLPFGKKIRVNHVEEACGGGAANTAVGLKRLGCDAAFCGVIGADQWGENMLKNLKKEGVETCCATIVEHETSSFSIIMNAPSGERVILNNNGTNIHLHDTTFDRTHAEGTDWIFLNHLHAAGSMIFNDIQKILEENPSVRLTWNPGSTQLKRGFDDGENAGLLRHTTLLSLNKEETLLFSKQKTLNEAFAVLLKTGVKVVCVTDGAKGSYATDGKTLAFCPALSTTVVDSTGAGDAFGTAATWALLEGENLPRMLAAGTINATSVLGKVGAQAGLLTDIEIRQRLQSTRLETTVRDV